LFTEAHAAPPSNEPTLLVHRPLSFLGFPARVLAALVAVIALAAAPARAQQAVYPEEAPVSAFVDSAALVQALGTLDLPAPGRMPPLFAIHVDSTGVAGVEPLYPDMPAAYAQPVLSALRAALKPQPRTPNGRFTYLRVVAGAGARIEQPTLQEDQPALANADAVSRYIAHVVSRMEGRLKAAGVTTYSALISFPVAADGVPDAGSARVRGSSGDAELDAEAVAAVARMRFRPARIEGVPVKAWVTLPLVFATGGG
jgi:TonB family protein